MTEVEQLRQELIAKDRLLANLKVSYEDRGLVIEQLIREKAGLLDDSLPAPIAELTEKLRAAESAPAKVLQWAQC